MKFRLWMLSGVKQSGGKKETSVVCKTLGCWEPALGQFNPFSSLRNKFNGSSMWRVVFGYERCQFEMVHMNYGTTPHWVGWGVKKKRASDCCFHWEELQIQTGSVCRAFATHPSILISLYFAYFVCQYEPCCNTETRTGWKYINQGANFKNQLVSHVSNSFSTGC